MNKTQLAAAVAERTGASPTDARKQVDAVLDSISTAVASGERVSLLGFGTFDSATRSARTARNPRTGASIDVPAAVVPRFRVGAAFKARVGEAGSPAPVVTGTAAADPGERQGAKPSAKGAKKVSAKPTSSGKKSAAKKAEKPAAKPAKKSSKKDAAKAPAKSSKKSSKGKKKK